MHHSRPLVQRLTLALFGITLVWHGCSNGTSGSSAGGRTVVTGGFTNTTQNGGASGGSGGVKSSGGTTTVSTGGATSKGGMTSLGGHTGGLSSNGGAGGLVESGTGGTVNSGGSTVGGITASTGGVTVKGGSSASGGNASGGQTVASSGGATSLGGGTGIASNGGSTAGACAIPQVLAWTSADPIIKPVSDSTHKLTAVKDPSVVRYNDKWHVFASSVSTTGSYNLVYTSFADFSSAASAPLYYMDKTPGFDTYTAAPQVFLLHAAKKMVPDFSIWSAHVLYLG